MEQLPRFDRDKKSLSKSKSRRFGQGRIVVAHEKFETNPWLTVSDLAVAGRPVQQNESEQGAPTVKLPRGQEFLLPECGSPDADLRSASSRAQNSRQRRREFKGLRFF